MKNFFTLIMIILVLFIFESEAQIKKIASMDTDLEIFIRTKDVPEDTTVKLKAIANTTPIWSPLSPYLIDTPNWQTSDIEVPANYDGWIIGWHSDGSNKYGMPSLGWAEEYEIEVTNLSKSASFQVGTYGWQLDSDEYIMYDWNDDKFTHWDGSSINDRLETRYNKDYLQPTPPRNFHCTNPSQTGYNPHFEWNTPLHPEETSFFYNMYRNTGSGYVKINQNPIADSSYTDTGIVINKTGSNTVYYYVKAFGSQSDESDASNVETVNTNIEKQNSPENELIFETEESKTEQSGYPLLTCHPNPFNPITNISYQLPTDGRVRITVYNLAGQTIAEVLNGRKSAGIYHVHFNGQALAGGVYLVRLQFNDRYLTKKFLLFK